MNQKTLILDIESSPLLVYVWHLKDQYVDVSQLHTDWKIMAWGAKWLGEKTVHYRDLREFSERTILFRLRELLEQADIVITQNGVSFDMRKINARFVLLGLKPVHTLRHFDTYLLAKRVASFTSNKLEYLTEKCNVKYHKLTHTAFPGLKLWKECLNGNIKAWEEMERYNIHDVLSTEELYENLKAFAPKAFPRPDNEKCDACGKENRLKIKCQSCGRWETQ
jgi:RNase_H superfamily